jgi:hypothetical protein
MRAYTMGDRLKQAINSGKEGLPAIGAGLAAAAAPTSGGLSELIVPVLAALRGGAAGTSAKQGVSAAIGSGDRPKSTTDALTEVGVGGIHQAEYEMSAKPLDAFLGHVIGTTASKANRARVANLTAMTGKGDQTGANFEKILSDIDDTVKVSGRPKSPLGVFNVIKQTGKRLDSEFNNSLALVGNQRVVPMDIANRIHSLITPDMAYTAEGRAARKEILDAEVEYQKPWTYYALNSKRMTNNNLLDPLYNKGSQGQAAALSDVQKKIAKAVRDESANMVYSAVDKVNPAIDAQLLKQRQGALWSLSDQLSDRVSEIHDAQLTEEGKTLRQKVSPSAVVTPKSAHGYVRGVSKLIPGGGPERQAAIQTRRAFKDSSSAIARRRAILAAPVANIMRGVGAVGSAATSEDDNDDQ